MTSEFARFLFLAAGAVGLFAFLSAVAWASSQFSYRKARDRYALLKSLAELPGENAARILDMLRADEERARRRHEEEERRGHLIGGLVMIAVGVGLVVMLKIVSDGPAWAVGLIPFLVGVVILPFGLRRRKPEGNA
jgi:hypothetical protein